MTGMSPSPVAFDPGPPVWLAPGWPLAVGLAVAWWALAQYAMWVTRMWRDSRDDGAT